MRPVITKWEESRQERIADTGNLNSQNSIENKEIICKYLFVNYLLYMQPYQVIYQSKA